MGSCRNLGTRPRLALAASLSSQAVSVEHDCLNVYVVLFDPISRRPVKNTLMDARFVVGVGNIYASEALWRARINPKTRAGRISRTRWSRLRGAVVEVLQHAISAGGTTLRDFRSATGDPGHFQIRLHVYDREGEPCSRCGSSIRRIVQAGRSTYYCLGCQH